MEQMWQKKIADILKTGKPLFEIGINNWALTKSEALTAIKQLDALGIGILGGDVYALTDEVFVSTYDNWYCDRGPNEEPLTFLSRSIDKAKQYIEAYNAQEPDKIFFALVPDF